MSKTQLRSWNWRHVSGIIERNNCRARIGRNCVNLIRFDEEVEKARLRLPSRDENAKGSTAEPIFEDFAVVKR